MKVLLSIITISLFMLALVLPITCFNQVSEDLSSNDKIFFGVTFGGNTTDEAKLLIDKVKDFTNLFIVDNWDVAMNETTLTEICNYAVNANLNVMVYFSFIFFDSSQLPTRYLDLFKNASVEPFHFRWLSTANERWGGKFLGAYVLDEPGGKQIDTGSYTGFKTDYTGRYYDRFQNITDYIGASQRFVGGLGSYYVQRLNNASRSNSIPNSTGKIIPVFTADNALYWFDYLAGYDAVFAELGWNHNQAEHIALCRGAANVQNKDWGVMLTWAQNNPPYLSSGTDLFRNMLTSYYAGAKYIVIFNYPQINPYGALTEEHFKAIKNFLSYIKHYPRAKYGKVKGEVAFVLPKDYGWGMRQANDNIWGLWPPDDLSPVIGQKIASLINKYGLKLDIIYDDPYFNYTEKYSKIFYWNSTFPFPV